ncbi:hypothetical protein NQ315_013380 [Exocentrus adspersus]|uniref:Diphosphomevalonate decarboxylase n=1 Tax=Exocentrus adspersus TaxID=1586481 RepID=A0AAV8VSR0_9CUCU|nr:hypothetical protein NQ315_013380 [Exocentrus adspersus]
MSSRSCQMTLFINRGKSDDDLIIPLNDSLSGTLSMDFMCAKTTVMASPFLTEDRFWLNNKEQSFENKRLQNCLKEVRNRANPKLPEIKWKIAICSENNFPTAAGLASSAAGYACLVSALAALYEIDGDISDIARRGSGSACRSMYGGWVRWCKGLRDDGVDSIAKQIASVEHWPEIRVLILVVNDSRKKYSSTDGMKRTVETSEFLKYRVQNVVPLRIEAITSAIKEKDFNSFARITMEDSNQFHAVCLDTFPPCIYMNDTSHLIVELVHAYNEHKGTNKVAYTFDAGPNACLYLLEQEVYEFLSLVNYIFPPASGQKDYIRGIPVIEEQLPKESSLHIEPQRSGLLKYIIHTKLGDGPQRLYNPEAHLLNETGVPKK